MKRHAISLAALALLVAAPIHAQETDIAREAEAFRTYESKKKTAWIAVALEFFVPVVGHMYAGDTERGYPPALLTLGGLSLAGVGAIQSLFRGGDENDAEKRLVYAGAVGWAAGRVWGLFSANQTVKDGNQALRESLGVADVRMDLSLSPPVSPRGGHRFGMKVTLRP